MNMRKILAVSGGIDSMVMLDFLCRSHPDVAWQVVTVDHGTRPSSAADAEFVAKTAKENYHLETKIAKLALGTGVSEAKARAARYAALFEITGKDGTLYLAHHLDDLVESVAINLLRGTGWRGLSVMDRPRVQRPLLAIAADKAWVHHYAAEHNIRYREDPTNQEDNYLRNRLRPVARALSRSTKEELYTLWRRQLDLKNKIDTTTTTILEDQPQLEKSFLLPLIEAAPDTADEIIRAWLLKRGISTTRPQRQDLMEAIKTYQPGKLFNLPGGIMLKISKNMDLKT